MQNDDMPQAAAPTSGMAEYQSIKRVKAGVITEVVPAGCYIQEIDRSHPSGPYSVLRIYQPGMTARYQPAVGDYWVVYEDGYESISPKAAFEAGYMPLADAKPRPEKPTDHLADEQTSTKDLLFGYLRFTKRQLMAYVKAK